MAIDTKQRRGSVIGVSLPFRQWIAEPTGSLPLSSRLSMLKYVASAVSAVTRSFRLFGALMIRPALDGDIDITSQLPPIGDTRPALEGIVQ